MTAVDAARRTAHDLVALLDGRRAPGERFAPGGRLWLPHRGWSEGDGLVATLDELTATISGGELVRGPVVASPHTAVVELELVREGHARVPITATLHLDADWRIVEARLYLDPVVLGVA